MGRLEKLRAAFVAGEGETARLVAKEFRRKILPCREAADVFGNEQVEFVRVDASRRPFVAVLPFFAVLKERRRDVGTEFLRVLDAAPLDVGPVPVDAHGSCELDALRFRGGVVEDAGDDVSVREVGHGGGSFCERFGWRGLYQNSPRTSRKAGAPWARPCL